MERDPRAAASTFRPLWTACGKSPNACETTSFVSTYLIEISRNFVALSRVRAALGGGPVGTYAGSIRRVAVAPAVEACRGVDALGEGQERSRDVRRRDGGGEQH